jgi:glucose/arabinose dehydrogenase
VRREGGKRKLRRAIVMTIGVILALIVAVPVAFGQSGPTMLVDGLGVRTATSGLATPVSMAFIGRDDMLVLEKNTGKVQRVVNGVVQSQAVLDLAVNSGSERGLLGIALHPNFPTNPGVYLYWTESTTGADSNLLSEVPLLGNRVDRFVWNGSTLTFDRNLIKLRAYQADGGQSLRGNHNGGVIRFGPDGKLYVIVGDVGRRGQMQNLGDGPTGPGISDDQFGGPEPDDAHLTSVILRLNDDGTSPTDNPFYAAGAAIGGEAGANIQRIFAYGIRNSFGMSFDPRSGNLWTQENGDDAFDELNLVRPGMNGGWVQIMGPASRIRQYKGIEVDDSNSLQQLRWPPTNIADSPAEARSRLFALPGSVYSDPEFSWKHAVAPAGLGFVKGSGLGRKYRGDLFVGAATTNLKGGYLFHFNLTRKRNALTVNDARLKDRVADNRAKFGFAESKSLLIGRGFGVGTDIQTGPSGNLYVVSPSEGVIYEIHRKGTN